MVRIVLTPNDTDLHLSIPQQYVGRKIEVMYYPVDELVEATVPEKPKLMGSFKGILSETEADSYTNNQGAFLNS